MKYFLFPLLLMLIACSNETGEQCKHMTDPILHSLALEDCMNVMDTAATPKEYTTNNSETHEIPRTCVSFAIEQASYYNCSSVEVAYVKELREFYGYKEE